MPPFQQHLLPTEAPSFSSTFSLEASFLVPLPLLFGLLLAPLPFCLKLSAPSSATFAGFSPTQDRSVSPSDTLHLLPIGIVLQIGATGADILLSSKTHPYFCLLDISNITSRRNYPAFLSPHRFIKNKGNKRLRLILYSTV